MKTLLTLASFLLISTQALATSPRYGEQCGFPNGFEEDSSVAEPITIEPGAKLNALQTQQVITAAQILAAPWNQAKPEATLESSIAYLVESSEGGEVYLKEGIAEKVVYTYLEFYPGGNPVGVIFKKGTLHDVAHIEDSDIVCTD